MDIAQDLASFLDRSVSPFHAMRAVGETLAQQGFIPLSEGERWPLERGQSYFFLRDDSSLCAFRLPSSPPEYMVILGTHSDSPALKIQLESPLHLSNFLSNGIDIYGSPLLNSWLNRDLAMAGRVLVMNGTEEVRAHCVQIDDFPLIIPQLAFHLDPKVNDQGTPLNKTLHFRPLFALDSAFEEKRSYVESILSTRIRFTSLLSADLFLYPLEKARFLGKRGELLASARLDNLLSVHAATQAIHFARASSTALQMALFWDHEEIGSQTYTGASSTLLKDTLDRIYAFYSLDRETQIQLKEHSLFLSADLAHGYNPNYQDTYDSHSLPLLGKGVVLKSSLKNYATGTATAAILKKLCRKAQLPLQIFSPKPYVPSGTTVGPLIASLHGIPSADIGVPSLSMHSTREIASIQDHKDLLTLLQTALEENLPDYFYD